MADKGSNRLVVGVGMVPRGEVRLIFASLGISLHLQGKPPIADGFWSYDHDGHPARTDQVGQQGTVAASGCISVRCVELPELQKRRQLVSSKLEMLNREQELLRKMAAEKRKETNIKASLGEFAVLVSSSLKRISFENKQKLLRMVLDRVVVNDWRVDVHYNTSRCRSRLQRQSKKCQPNSIYVPHVY
jgi:hypothetical protein